ncbi:hypothetical protein [Erwinia tracheiphila]|nr:hypothetical protein [Erwinia tracheiphila]
MRTRQYLRREIVNLSDSDCPDSIAGPEDVTDWCGININDLWMRSVA